MTNLKGGYIIINKGDVNIYASLENALTSGKPVLFYEDADTCYFIDSISKSGDDIVLTKGGKTFTITEANVVTESGDIQNHLYALMFDGSDLSLGDESMGDSQYYTILSTINGKLSDLPVGKYACLTGDINGQADISHLIKTANGYKFYVANDNEFDFTISDDNEPMAIKLF